MVAPERLQSFARRKDTTLFYVFSALANSLECIGMRGKVEQALIGSGILHDCFCFAIDGEDQRFLGLFETLHELGWIAAEGCHRLNILFDVEHDDLAAQC